MNLTKGQYIEKRTRPSPDDVTFRDYDEDEKRVRMPVSSTVQDRDGDEFSREGLEDMRDQLREGSVPMMLDHGWGGEGPRYGANGIVGRWVDGDVETETHDGEEHHILYGEGLLDPDDEHAEKVGRKLANDMPIGASVGFRVHEYEGGRDDGYTFNGVDLLETSLVGIPSNPVTVNDSPTGQAAKYGAPSTGQADAVIQTLAAVGAIDEDALDAGAATELEPDASGTRSTMSDDDTGGDDPANDNDIQELRDAVENQTETVGDLVDSIESLVDAGGDAGDDEEKDTTPEDDTDDEPDTRSLEVVLRDGDDVGEKALEEFEALKDYANDDGEIKLADSETTLFAGSGEDEVDADNEVEI